MTRRRPPAEAPVPAVPNGSGGCSLVAAGEGPADEVEGRVVLAGGGMSERFGRCLVGGPAQVVEQVVDELSVQSLHRAPPQLEPVRNPHRFELGCACFPRPDGLVS